MRCLLVARAVVVLAVCCLGWSPWAHAQQRTALDEYVAAPDASYEYKLISTNESDGLTTYVLEMTSQTWLTAAEVDQPVWKHWLIISKPPEVVSSTGFLFISGGANGGSPPTKSDGLPAHLAKNSKSVVTELKMVPNQGLTFAGENFKRSEDSLIAYTWDKFLRTGDPKWPARLPMTKSAVRAMDTITSFCASDEGGKVKVDRFVVAGGSKRGWTTWTTAIVDKRVVGIVPLVIDMLNIEPSFRHHWEAYGFWAPAVGDYVRMKVMDWNGTPQYRALMKIEEPFEYRDRLTMPKLIVNATGDQFFLPDSSQFYFKDLLGPKYLRYVPNCDHSMRDAAMDVPFTVLAFYNALLTGAKLPEYDWIVEPDDSIKVLAKSKPSEVKLWQASNPKARDFRLQTIGKAWKSTPLAESEPGQYLAKVEKPAEGFTAFMVELTYPMPSGPPLKVTTQVKVVPDTLPFTYQQPVPPQ